MSSTLRYCSLTASFHYVHIPCLGKRPKIPVSGLRWLIHAFAPMRRRLRVKLHVAATADLDVFDSAPSDWKPPRPGIMDDMRAMSRNQQNSLASLVYCSLTKTQCPSRGPLINCSSPQTRECGNIGARRVIRRKFRASIIEYMNPAKNKRIT
jgi:hypothetical protein